MPVDERDGMLREMARHRGFRLVKSRRRKPGAGDYGRYGLADARSGKECFGFGRRGLEATAEEIEQFLRGKAQAEWKSSLNAPVERSQARPRKPVGREHRRHSERMPPPRPAHPARVSKPTPKAASPRRAPLQAELPAKQPALTIREAGPRDAESIVQLLTDIGEPVDSKSIRKTIAALSRQGTPLLVADQEGVLGCVGWTIMMIPQYTLPVGRITLLLTAKSARRRGIGTALLQAVEGHFRAKRCGLIELIHDIELSSANSFLRERSYKRSGYRFARELSGSGAD